MSTRLSYLLCFIVVVFLLLLSFYLEYFQGVIPCPLCTLQRLTFCLLGGIFLLGIILNRKRWQRLFLNTLVMLTSLLGLLLASRQIWIQHFPVAGNNDCSVSFGYMLETFPMNQVLKKIIFEGGTECAKRGFEFLHFNMAEWAFIWFLSFLLFASCLFLQELRRH